MEINKVYFALIIFLVGIFLGFSVGILYKSKQAAQNSNIDQKLLSQLEKAKKIFPPILEMRSVSGTIKKINKNTVTIESSPPLNPFEEFPLVRDVLITENTKIVKQEQKNSAEFQKEIEAYQKKISEQAQANLSIPILPLPFIEKEIKIDGIKEGNIILVEADENIKAMTSFKATKIIVQASALTAPPAFNILTNGT